MHEERRWFARIDWASQEQVVSLMDGQGKKFGQRKFAHGGTGLGDMMAWLLKASGGEPGEIHVAIETLHGPIVEALLERGFNVYSINPKQLDRFRDRFTVAGAKDDSLRTDMRLFRKLSVAEPLIVELREWSRIDEELKVERRRHANRLRDQLWRYYPQMLELADDLADNWVLDLWQAAPTPEKAARVREATIARVLKQNCIRRFDAAHVLNELRKPALSVAQGTTEAATTAHIRVAVEQLRLINRTNGASAARRVRACIGSRGRPMTNVELDRKFTRQRKACCQNPRSMPISRPFAASRPWAMRAFWLAVCLQHDAAPDVLGACEAPAAPHGCRCASSYINSPQQ
jgi:Transposase